MLGFIRDFSPIDRLGMKSILLLAALSLLLAACPASDPDEQGGTPTSGPSATVSPNSTAFPSPTPAPTVAPTPSPTLEPVGWRKTSAPPRVTTEASYWIEVDVSDRRKIMAAVFEGSGSGPHPVVVFLHGIEGFRERHLELAKGLSEEGMTVVAGCWFDAYTESTAQGDAIRCPGGPPVLTLSFAPITAAVTNISMLINSARTLPNVQGDNVALFGNSLGSIAGTAVAITGARLKALVASSGYVTSYVPFGIAGIQTPVLILHGTLDPLIPVREAQKFEAALLAAGKDVEVKYYEGAPHEILQNPEWRDRVRADAAEFLKRKLGIN